MAVDRATPVCSATSANDIPDSYSSAIRSRSLLVIRFRTFGWTRSEAGPSGLRVLLFTWARATKFENHYQNDSCNGGRFVFDRYMQPDNRLRSPSTVTPVGACSCPVRVLGVGTWSRLPLRQVARHVSVIEDESDTVNGPRDPDVQAACRAPLEMLT